MDPFLLVIWIVRLLFLALLYLFLARVVGSLLRDLRAAAREPGASPGRLVVVESPAGEPEAGPFVRPRRDHDARPGREQRDRHRRPVRLDGARGADVPGPKLVRRGPRKHERDVRERAGGRRRLAARLRRRGVDRAGPPPSRTSPRLVTARERSRARATALPRILGPIRPRPRWTEARLLALAAIALRRRQPVAASRRSTGRVRPRQRTRVSASTSAPSRLAHVAQVLAGRRTDQVLLPVVGLLGGISLLLMQRLPAGPGHARRGRFGARPGRCPAGLAGPRDRRRDDPRDRRALRCVAAPLQVHVGGGRHRAAAPDLHLRRRRRGPAADAPPGPDQRSAVRAAQGHPRRLPRGLPLREPAAADRAGHAPRAAPAPAAAVPRADGRDVGHRARDRGRSSAISARHSCSSPCSSR